MVRSEVLSPAESGKYISEHSEHVSIHDEGIDRLCDQMLTSIIDKKITIPEIGAESIHPNANHPRAVDWVFVMDALNFCFWSCSKSEQWKVDGHTGYCALEAALYRAIKNGYDITNPEYYLKITTEQLADLFKGDTDAKIPLLLERLRVLHEVGSVLIEKYKGTFETCVKEANKSAVTLLKIVVENFPCFKDEAIYKDKKVSFYKRAQILIADLWNFFKGKGFGEFHDIDKLTMFADYRVPQVLVYFEVLSYSDSLVNKLMSDSLLPSGSDEEIEIRGCSIHSIELLKQRLQNRIEAEQISAEVPNSSLIDFYLWSYRRKHAKELEKVPYHKTLSIYY